MRRPVISVVIPTHNRAELLEAALDSFATQRFPPHAFQVVVVDDGSTDATAQLCHRVHATLPLVYLRQEQSGTSAAKNLGLFAAGGALVLFFDDDDVAAPDLLWEHLRAHQRYPEEQIAVLGYTTWHPRLPRTEVMHYITDVGALLFGYPHLRDGQLFDFTKFWTGRISCKRSFLLASGVFDDRLAVYEDVELGFRLGHHGLRVLFHRNAVSYMNRPITYDQFCRRCEIQGHYCAVLRALHTDPEIERYCLAQVADGWRLDPGDLSARSARARELEVALGSVTDPAQHAAHREELYALYKQTFRAFRHRGAVAALATPPQGGERKRGVPAGSPSGAPR